MTATTAARIRTVLEEPPGSIVVLTLGLGVTVGTSWTVVGGSVAWQGGIESVIRDSSLPLFGLEAMLAACITFAVVRWSRPASVRHLAALVIGAWLGELVVLTLGGWLVANEINAGNAWWFWLIGTGGPIQPIAAIIGGLVAVRPSGPSSR